MVPGVSRSGATIVGAMLFGADKRAATEFSFWLAMPTMVGAFALKPTRSRAELAGGNLLIIAIGFAVSFVCGWFVVKIAARLCLAARLCDLFAWWRIAVGALGPASHWRMGHLIECVSQASDLTAYAVCGLNWPVLRNRHR